MSSAAQRKLLAQLEGGARLSWLSAKGKYQLTEGSIVRTVDPRTVDQLVQDGRIWRDLAGGCVLAPQAGGADSGVPV